MTEVEAGRPSARALSLLVFGAGTGTLAVEISASRLLAPYYGSSTIVWANLIGLVLLALSLGYWLGGKLADRRPSGRLLGRLVLAAGRDLGAGELAQAMLDECRSFGQGELLDDCAIVVIKRTG